MELQKKPGIAETLDWTAALLRLGISVIDDDGAERILETLSALIKTRDDRAGFTARGRRATSRRHADRRRLARRRRPGRGPAGAPGRLCRLPARQWLRHRRRRCGRACSRRPCRPACSTRRSLRWSLQGAALRPGDEWRRFDALFDAYFLPPNDGVRRQRRAAAAARESAGRGGDGGDGDAPAAPAQAAADDARHGAARREPRGIPGLDRFPRARIAPRTRATIEALMRRFARRLKHLRLRREARCHARPPARPAGHDPAQRGERRHAVAARLEGARAACARGWCCCWT